MTNKELQELLKQYPDDVEIVIYRPVKKRLVLCANPEITKLLDDLLVIE